MVPPDSGRGDCTGDPALSGGLRGATGSHRWVAEFLQWSRSENGTARDEITGFLSSNDNAISEYRHRDLSTGEDPVALVSDFHSND